MKKSTNVLCTIVLTIFISGIIGLTKADAQSNPAILLFDRGSGSTAINHGDSGLDELQLKEGTSPGNGSTVGPAWSVETPFAYTGNHSLQFHGGSDWVDVGDFPVTDLTVEAWIKPDSSDQSYLYIAQAGNEKGLKYHFRVHPIEGQYELEGLLWDNGEGAWGKMTTSGGAITRNIWQHVAMTYSADSGGELFLNGTKVDSMPPVAAIELDRYWRIGQPFGSSMRGFIDEVRISDFVRVPGDGSGEAGTLAWNNTLSGGGSVFVYSPRRINFGFAEIGTETTDSVIVKNNSDSLLTVHQVEVTNPAFTVSPDSIEIPAGADTTFQVVFHPESEAIFTGEVIFHHNNSSSQDTLHLEGTGLDLSGTAVTEPFFHAKDSAMYATLVIPGAFSRAWKQEYGINNIYADRETLTQAINTAVQDIKGMGFNSVILSSFFFPSTYIPYLDYVKIFAEAGERFHLGIIPSFKPPGNPPGAEHEIWVESGEFKERTKTFVDTLSKYPSVIGFNHAFEAWGQTSGHPEEIKRLRTYIELKKRFYNTIPAAGLEPPAGVYTVATAQLNPKLYSSQEKMNNAVEYWTNEAYPESGVEINLWHSQLLPEYGYPEGEEGFKKWETFQRNGILLHRPKHITLFTYQHLVADYDPTYNNHFYTPRGWVKHVLYKLEDRNLLFYDPRLSDFSTEIIGGTFKNGSIYYPVYDEYTQEPNLSAGKGNLLLWTSNNTVNTSLVLVSTDSSSGVPLFQLSKTDDNTLKFTLGTADSQTIGISTDISAWVPGEQYHVSADWDTSTGKISLSVNGKTEADTTASWTPPALPDSIIIGDTSSTVINEVRIYGDAQQLSVGKPTLNSPENESTGVPLKTTLEWNPVSGARSYRVQISMDSVFSDPVIDLSGLQRTEVGVEIKEDSTEYFWRVGAVSEIELINWSDIWHFTTENIVKTEDEGQLPREYHLSQNYPNPFNPTTKIGYTLPNPAEVSLGIYNLRGEKIVTLVNKPQDAGWYSVTWDGRSSEGSIVSTGVYFYRLQTERFTKTKKMIFLR